MMEIKEDYKLSSLLSFPIEWDLKKFGELCLFSQGLQVPVEEQYDDSQGKVRFLRIIDYTQKGVQPRYIKNNEKKHFISKEDLIMIRYGNPGFVGIGKEGIIANNMFKVIPKFDNITTQYLYIYLSQLSIQLKIKKMSTSTTMPAISFKSIDNLPITIPPIKEQQKIAEILSTVDKQIEQTNQLIEKTKELKKGLMQQLMTKGIQNTKFKQSRLGEIPAEWKVKELGSIGEIIIGLTYSPEDLVKNSDDGILVLRSSNIRGNKLDFKDIKYVSSDISDKLLTKENDILICSRNGSRRLLGKSALIGSEHVGLTFGAFMSMYRSIYNTYLIHFFDTNLFKKQVYRNLGATINQITSSDLKQFKIALPPLEEQQKIADILSSVDEDIEGYVQEKFKYEELKKGLMQQLLTGKIRVKVD